MRREDGLVERVDGALHLLQRRVHRLLERGELRRVLELQRGRRRGGAEERQVGDRLEEQVRASKDGGGEHRRSERSDPRAGRGRGRGEGGRRASWERREQRRSSGDIGGLRRRRRRRRKRRRREL